jgi:hypothetical protein
LSREFGIEGLRRRLDRESLEIKEGRGNTDDNGGGIEGHGFVCVEK